MTDKALWNEFITKHNINEADYTAWAFGAEADLLAHLTATGEKNATSSAYQLYETENEPLPKAGDYSVILDAQNNAVCVIQMQRVYVTAFHDVSAEHAFKEGEGDKSLAYWRKVHKEFFTACLEEAHLKFSDDMKVVCEEFKVVYRK